MLSTLGTLNFMEQVRLEEFLLHKMKSVFMGIWMPALSQNGSTKLVVWIFGGKSKVPPLCFSLPSMILDYYCASLQMSILKRCLYDLNPKAIKLTNNL
jgi:hypothetical protein